MNQLPQAVTKPPTQKQANPQTTAAPQPRTFCEGRFEFIDKLGEGSYGKVYKVIDRLKKEVVALKKVKFHGENCQGIPQSSLRELAILKEINHPNVVNLQDILGSKEGGYELYLVFELVDSDLRKFLQCNNHKLSRSQVKFVMHELVKGIDHLHRNRIIHRDLKPENILISRQGDKVKIADFGLSRTIHMPLRPYSREILSLWYKSPELCMGYKNYSIGVDTWAIGCIFFELVAGHSLFKAKSDTEMLFKIFEVFGTPNKDNWDWVRKIAGFTANFPNIPGRGLASLLVGKDICLDGLDLMSQLLEMNPLDRISCLKALEHPYFKAPTA